MKNVPKVIYLQVLEDGETCDDFNKLFTDAVTWCSERINKSDIKYVREPLNAKNEASNDILPLVSNRFCWVSFVVGAVVANIITAFLLLISL